MNYSELLGERPVLETLEIVERHFRSIVPAQERKREGSPPQGWKVLPI